MLISNYWTEDTPPEQHYFIWIVREDDSSSAWLRRGFSGDFEMLVELSKERTSQLLGAVEQSSLHRWKRRYENKDLGWYIGSNAWGITLVAGNAKVSTADDDGYPAMLQGLCEELRELGVPVGFKEGHGLEYTPIKKGKRKRKAQQKRGFE